MRFAQAGVEIVAFGWDNERYSEPAENAGHSSDAFEGTGQWFVRLVGAAEVGLLRFVVSAD